MEENKEYNENLPQEDQKVPEIVKEEADDKPAGRNIFRSIIIAIIILVIIYFIYVQMRDGAW
ncbi:hypothetical protein GQF61_05025 [Sphingobacterium sp. DK4209]|uniref:Uncharacterized protein n=1 Tax=Sphingobacterium zhuxiongii TaxID=2662364 RepID=A0A5Q0Q9E2_9SPHI|nr:MULTISPECIES: hypothetical protein [unclassified Sphingobacterium]MVZ65206.1 hypothetical protein [Sphingobacterium sp. DK4209]QGA26153.1 hypothetical protein GFH32_07355 [Sphingobacterium sp. dk4302]